MDSSNTPEKTTGIFTPPLNIRDEAKSSVEALAKEGVRAANHTITILVPF
ncbi:hypothetical protein AMTR_s00029p00108430 [Amborella trichopoda]|uniref:Uncharacterized protein n=1 Tax=Amborella trichopoda TaxID=13333 RepID=W1PHK5_AMBTC|nr:hypothetical protein AMTR_s00029p00108430 [Amborella trichopoda]